MKPSLIRVLESLGFTSGRDLDTIVPPDSFEKLDDALVMNMIDEYKLGLSGVYVPLDGERKLELVNRVLELKHGMIIDEVRDFEKGEGGKDKDGYELENITL